MAAPTATRTVATPRTSQRRLRIAHVVTNFTTGSGGITLRGALALDPDRYSSTMIAPERTATLFGAAEAAGLDVVRLQRLGGARRVYPSDMRALFEMKACLAAGDFDIVHTHGARGGAIGRVAARMVGVPTIVHTLHGFPFNQFQPAPARRALREIERRLGRITDYFVTDGTIVASEAVRLGIARAEQIRSIISPIDPMPRRTDATRRDGRAALGLPIEALVIGTTARLARQKAPLDMVKAFAALGRRDVYMVWVGDGDLREETERAISDAGLRDRFLVLGERDDVPRLLPAFDVFVMPSLWEGLPCSIVEAMTCGIPVVATAVNSTPEVVVAGRTGLIVPPADPASLARALAYMLDHPTEAARMAATAQAEIGEQFRADLLGRELTSVYESAVELSRSRRDEARA